MKIIPFSVWIGLGVLGIVGCGNSSNPGSSIGTPAGGAGTQPSGGGSGNSAPVGSNAGTGDLNVQPGDGAAGAATQTCDTATNKTTISGVVLDPANKNPLYNISVFLADPEAPLPDLDSVPVGCGCTQLLPTKVKAIGNPTNAEGKFTIPCAPSGNVTLVVQTGKWRRVYENVAVKPNQDNVVPNLRLPANSAEGSLPNIAISTGASDSFECLPLRLGVSASEYVAGSAKGGHIHIYTGAGGASPPQGSVESYRTLWDTQEHLNEHDVVVLSCEGQETTGGGRAPVDATAQQYLMNYANTGGRVFASHYHYAWFNSGPFATGANNLATWKAPSGMGMMGGLGTLDDTMSFPAEVNTTLSGGAAFPEGAALAQWLGLVGALTNNQLPVNFARNNVEALMKPPSTEWIHLAPDASMGANAVQYFSADTPVGAAGNAVCGRVVYSALHVSGGPNKNAPGVPVDYPIVPAGAGGAGGGGGFPRPGAQENIVPTGCATHPLTPQEAALEFMFFDLSSCLVPIGMNPTPPPIPK